jgi:hypothetical protein
VLEVSSLIGTQPSRTASVVTFFSTIEAKRQKTEKIHAEKIQKEATKVVASQASS